MKKMMKIASVFVLSLFLSGCLVTSVVGAAASAASTAVGAAVSVVDAVTPDVF